ncbi:hypothetical protein ACFL6R_01790 [Gemmatimonadota bacterium]
MQSRSIITFSLLVVTAFLASGTYCGDKVTNDNEEEEIIYAPWPGTYIGQGENAYYGDGTSFEDIRIHVYITGSDTLDIRCKWSCYWDGILQESHDYTWSDVPNDSERSLQMIFIEEGTGTAYYRHKLRLSHNGMTASSLKVIYTNYYYWDEGNRLHYYMEGHVK